VRYVTPAFLRAMGIDVVEGEGFGDPMGPRAILINRAMARSGFLGDHPIGQQVYMIGNQPWVIRGIVEDVRQFDVQRPPDPQVFFDLRQLRATAPPAGQPWPGRVDYFAVRTDGMPESAIANIRTAVRELDQQAIVENVATMKQILANSISRPRLYATLLGTFAAAAVVLAAIGIFGVISFAVTQRVREIGIRLALGAAATRVGRMVLGDGLRLVAIGTVAGLVAALSATKFLRAFLYEVEPTSVVEFAIASLLLVVVTLSATLLPARRAARTHPAVILRGE
jgi:predicted lysophospholipase L1 biosynthesis ABC-type transport system permease subunit